MKAGEKLLEKVCVNAASVGGIFLFSLSILITVDVVVRKSTGKPLLGIFEVSEVIFLISTFLALGVVHRRGRQIRVDVLLQWAKGKRRYILEAFSDLLALAFFGLLLWVACLELVEAWRGNFARGGMIEIPITIHLAFLILGTFLILLALLSTTIFYMRRIIGGGEMLEEKSSNSQ